MSATISERVASLGYVLPTPSAPAANYLPWVRTGDLLYISGQLPMLDGRDLYVGKLGGSLSIEAGQKAAQICALNLLAHLSTVVDDDLSRVVCCVRLGGFVNAVPDFSEHPQVINGASDFMSQVLGDSAGHTRIAVGASSLPRDVAVEVDGVFEIR